MQAGREAGGRAGDHGEGAGRRAGVGNISSTLERRGSATSSLFCKYNEDLRNDRSTHTIKDRVVVREA